MWRGLVAEFAEPAPADTKHDKMAALKAKGSSKLRKSAAVDSLVPGAGRFQVLLTTYRLHLFSVDFKFVFYVRCTATPQRRLMPC